MFVKIANTRKKKEKGARVRGQLFGLLQPIGEDVLHEQQGTIGHFTGEEELMTGVSTHIKEPDSQLKLKRGGRQM